jgi:hypothetical protein
LSCAPTYRSSLILYRHVIRAAKNAINLDERQVDAVAVRIELDLRIGYAFTRFQTTTLRALGGPLGDATISYGELPCTLVHGYYVLTQSQDHASSRLLVLSSTATLG